MPTESPVQGKITTLPPDTIEFAHRMFDAARTGNSELVIAALDAGLPLNIMNEKGKCDTVHESSFELIKPNVKRRQHFVDVGGLCRTH